jgi:hypothetical protein
MDIERMDCTALKNTAWKILASKHRLNAKQLVRPFLHSLAAVSVFVVAIGALYLPFDRYRATQRRHVTVLECDMPTSDATVVSLIRVLSDQMSAAAKPRLTLVDLHNQKPTKEIPWSDASPSCIAATHDQRRLFVGTTDGAIFALDREQCGGQRQLIGDHGDGQPSELAISPNDNVLVSRGFRSLYALDLRRNLPIWKRSDLDANAIAICSNTTLVCGTNTGEILELSLATGKTLRLLARHRTCIRHLSAAAGTLAAVDGAGQAILFRSKGKTWVRRPADKIFSGNNRLCLSADGKRAVGTSRDNARLICWDLNEQEPICHMSGHKGIIISAGFLPDGTILSCGNDGTVRVWDLAAHGALRLVTRVSPLFAG